MAQTLLNLGVKRAMVVCGDDGLDEITLTTTTQVCEVKDGKLNSCTINPRDYGLLLCKPDDLVGGDAKVNAGIARDILSGKKGPKRDVVLINAGACLFLTQKADTLRSGMDLAARMLDEGLAQKKMEQFVLATKEVLS